VTRSRFPSRILQAAALTALLLIFSHSVTAQSAPVERLFPQSKSAVEKALKQLQSSMSGRLPALEGFTLVGDHPLSQYQRAFYQCSIKVTSVPAGRSVVRVSAKVTAWYADANNSRSGYQLLLSNGRLEADLLDQLSDQLSGTSSDTGAGEEKQDTPSSAGTKRTTSDEPTLSAPMPRTSDSGAPFPSSRPTATPTDPLATRRPGDAPPSGSAAADQKSEVASLEEVLKNQAHPKNLVAVKKSGTPILASPSLTAKTLFMASAQDEFEMLDFNADWVHVRISGLSRGWIWRTGLEMPEGIPDVPLAASAGAQTAADLFQISREEVAPFPGDWEPLRGKSVRIISVQKIHENEQEGGAHAKLEYAKSLLDKNYDELAKSSNVFGLVLIFDSVDGGMIAATVATLRRWKAGGLTDAALWHQCYFDPPETFGVSTVKGSP
jgi:hypothetical protein